MGIDKSLNDDYPSILINGTAYHFGRELEYGDYLVENAHYAKDYWCFKTPEDMLAFLVNLPEAADRNRMRKLYPDWHEVTPEQRDVHFEDSRARLRTAMEEKKLAGTARKFPVCPDDGSGPYRGQEPFRIEIKEPLAQIERTISDLKRYQGFDRGLNDAGKLRMLEGFDWSGISDKDKEAILQRDVNFTRITEEQFEFVYEDIHIDTGRRVSDQMARKLFEAATPPGKGQTVAAGTVHFHGFDCEVKQRTYTSGRPALCLIDVHSQEIVAVATAELPTVPLKPGEILIKDHAENRGMLEALENAGIVQATGRTVRSGFVDLPVAKMLTLGHALNQHRHDARISELFGTAPPAPTPEPEPQPHHSQNHRHKR